MNSVPPAAITASMHSGYSEPSGGLRKSLPRSSAKPNYDPAAPDTVGAYLESGKSAVLKTSEDHHLLMNARIYQDTYGPHLGEARSWVAGDIPADHQPDIKAGSCRVRQSWQKYDQAGNAPETPCSTENELMG
jgi:hypothetical protein